VTEYYAVTDLGTLPGGGSSDAYDINDVGQVVGSSDVAGGKGHAFLGNPTTLLKDLGTLPGGSDSQASGISVCGLVAGQSDLAGSGGKTHAFVWSSGWNARSRHAGRRRRKRGRGNQCGWSFTSRSRMPMSRGGSYSKSS
jgi:probable HAF family extracellular repeat protein